jgi:hypothetical protein
MCGRDQRAGNLRGPLPPRHHEDSSSRHCNIRSCVTCIECSVAARDAIDRFHCRYCFAGDRAGTCSDPPARTSCCLCSYSLWCCLLQSGNDAWREGDLFGCSAAFSTVQVRANGCVFEFPFENERSRRTSLYASCSRCDTAAGHRAEQNSHVAPYRSHVRPVIVASFERNSWG